MEEIFFLSKSQSIYRYESVDDKLDPLTIGQENESQKVICHK